MRDRVEDFTRREALAGLGGVTAVPTSTAAIAGADEPRSKAVRTAVERAQSYLLDSGIRHGDYWESRIRKYGKYSDVRATTYYLLLLDHLGIDNRSKREALGYMLDQRSSGGGWNDTAVNFGVRFFLRSHDPEKYGSVIDDVTAEIEEKGMSITGENELQTKKAGTGPFNSIFQIKLFFSVMNDRYAVEELFPNDGYKKLTKLLAVTPAFDPDEGIEPTEPMVHQAFVATFLSFATIAEVIREREEEPKIVDGEPLSEQLVKVVLRRRLPNGVWGPAPDTVFGTLAVYAATDHEPSDEAIQLPLDWIARDRQGSDGHIITFRMPIWDTALALRALHDSGYPTDHSAIRRGAQYLLDTRTVSMAASPLDVPLDRLPVPFRENFGDGWGYTPYIFSDWDDTAIVVSVLSMYGTEFISGDVEFLFDVQNDDGSWSAFVSNFSPLEGDTKEEIIDEMGEYAYQFLFNTHASPDVTGHVLEALGQTGHTVENSQSVRDAIDYYRRSQKSNDMWLGVWGAGYTYGTSSALLGMKEVGVDMDQQFVQNAVDALLEKQFDNGGWGDDTAWDFVKDEIPYTSKGPKNSQTGWVVQALIAAGLDPTHPAIEDGVGYLLGQQRTDGSWGVQEVGANFGPPYYKNETTTQSAALRALSYYANAQGISLPGPDSSGWLDGLFDWL